jgi:hypothetical protein
MSQAQSLANQLGNVPDYISQGPRPRLNANARANLTSSFAVIGYKGARWRIKYRGDWTTLEASAGVGHDGRPLPVSPVPTLDVVVCGMSASMSKTFYEHTFVEGADDPPDCFSVNGIAPDPAAPKKQHTSCALCPQNRFGSRITQRGAKAKACADHRRLSVVPAGDEENDEWGGPMLLRVPTMSLNNLVRYATELDRLGYDIAEVVTRLSFNTESAYPEIRFAVVSWVTPDGRKTVLEHMQSEQVRRMLEEEVIEATADRSPEPPGSMAQTLGPRPAHLQAPKQEQPAPAPTPAPQPQPAAQATSQVASQPPGGRVTPFSRAQKGNGSQPAQPAQAAPAGAQPAPAPRGPGRPSKAQTQAQGAPEPQGEVQQAPAEMEAAIMSQIDSLLDEPTD